MFELQKAKEKMEEARRYTMGYKLPPTRHYDFSISEINPILELLLPQDFKSATSAIRNALWQIDPSWKKGQFKVFDRHFRMQLLRSFFTPRFSLNDSMWSILTETQLLERILLATQNFEDDKKAAYYGKLLSEYILRCPLEYLPTWADSYKYLPNWLVVYKLHSELWQIFYW
jgi:hypothetical protein